MYSHQQAIAQSETFLKQFRLPATAMPNTAMAAKFVAESGDPDQGGYRQRGDGGPVRAGSSGAQHQHRWRRTPPGSSSSSREKPTAGNRFSLLFTVDNKPGKLAEVIQIIGASGYDMESIKSRPLPHVPFDYYFYVELVGDATADETAALLRELDRYLPHGTAVRSVQQMSDFIGTKLTMNLGERSYDIILKSGALENLYQFARLDRKVAVVTDSGVPAQYAQRVADQCQDATIITVPQGEASKSFQNSGNGAAADAGLQHGPGRPGGGRGRRCGGRPGRICRFHLYARHRFYQLPHHHPFHDRFLHRRQDRCGSGRYQEHRGRFLAAQAGHRGPGHPVHPAPPPLHQRSGRGGQGQPSGRPGAVFHL